MNSTEQIKRMSRSLWEEVFREDSKEFLDYYDRCMADHNRIYLDEEAGEAISMLHRNPYRIHMGASLADVSYIVGVATKEAYRHQGRMRRLLYAALQDSYQEKEPFVYLMPASEKIYLPFGFRTVYYQDVLTVGNLFRLDSNTKREADVAAAWLTKAGSRLSCKKAETSQIEEVAAFSDRVLARHCGIYTERTVSYFQSMWEEQRAVNGGVLLFYQENEMVGYCFSGMEDAAEVWELVIDPASPQLYAQAIRAITEYFADTLPVKISGSLPGVRIEGVQAKEYAYRPLTMVRITNLSVFAQKLRAEETVDVVLELTDDFLPQNNGVFRLTITEERGYLQRLIAEEAQMEAVKMTIEEFTDVLFGIREKDGFPSGKIAALRPLYLNELV